MGGDRTPKTGKRAGAIAQDSALIGAMYLLVGWRGMAVIRRGIMLLHRFRAKVIGVMGADTVTFFQRPTDVSQEQK